MPIVNEQAKLNLINGETEEAEGMMMLQRKKTQQRHSLILL